MNDDERDEDKELDFLPPKSGVKRSDSIDPDLIDPDDLEEPAADLENHGLEDDEESLDALIDEELDETEEEEDQW